MNPPLLPAAPTPVRCAIYTRKSTEENLDSDFNSLDAQRESAEAFIRSQAPEGWVCLDQPCHGHSADIFYVRVPPIVA
jgi:hypothetical protein